jgi:multiple sugar transport system substrate-binding protein
MSEKKSRQLSRREFLKLGGSGLATAAFISACGGAQPTQAPAPAAQATTAPAAAAPTTAPAAKPPAGPVEFLAWGDTTDGPAWEKLGPAYTAMSGVTVNITPVADPNANFYTKLQTMFAGGTPPHLASFQGWE